MPSLPDRLAEALKDRYTLQRELGRGGMATVFLATDLKHDRQVALKVLRPELAQALGPERFLREIAIAARLTHPNILPLLDSGEADGTLFYAMPFVEGESLRDRLAREGQLPVDDAVKLAQRVAAALGYAHGLGVVHRDIKPENILLSGGEPLVADFGIAKAVSAAGQTKLTESGFAVGTAPYMSPEQASGRANVAAASDIYALGCVLYELLAGAVPFTGPTVHAITARKLSEPVPPLRHVRDTVPVGLEQIVFKALAKLPADRYATAQQLAEALEVARTSATTPVPPGPADAPAPADLLATLAGPRRWRTALTLVTTAVVAAAAGAALTWRYLATSTTNLPVTRLTIRPLEGDSIAVQREGAPSSLAISPDGRRVAFLGVHGRDTTSRLYVRDLGTGVTAPLRGTEGAYAPFFKSDGGWIGYFEAGTRRLMKVPSQGGQPQPICDCGPSLGADWGSDGWIVFDPGRDRVGLQRVRETGGRPETLPVSESTFSTEVWALTAPRLLPDGKTALVSAWGATNTRVSALSLETGARTDLVTNAWLGLYVDPGYLVYATAAELWAVRLDLRRLTVIGAPVRVVDSVQSALDWWAEYALSRSGTLVYGKPVGVTGRDGARLVWVDRDDRIEPVAGVPGGCWLGPRLSPDGRRIVFWGWTYGTCGGGAGGRVWLYDRSGGGPRPLTDEAYTSAWPIFSRDGRSVVSNSNRDGGSWFPLYRTPVDGGVPERLTTMIGDSRTTLMQQPSSWSPDGTTLALQQGFDPTTLYDSYLLSLTGEGGVRPLLATKANERAPTFSPDGRWLAYVSDESGRTEIYVRPYPAFDAPVQVTRDGGDAPAWSANGRELFFRRRQGIFAVSFDSGRTGAPRRLINGAQRPGRNALAGFRPYGRNYDQAPDGRFLTLQLEANIPNGAEYEVVLNWFTELRARFAAGR